MVFNIGNQTGGVVNNVAGDQYVSGGQHGIASVAEARSAARDLRAVIERLELPGPVRVEALEVERELGAQQPERARVAGRLERLTGVLSSTGALATAGAALTGPLIAIARWLGEAGAPLLRILSA
ncbi:hypothetical protein ACPPVO_21575 [Dactylosporangium sp. McL0621]|uniref:hypothetical protein n=1 Tax=Dactylosporangium sp. McL0621 TaxID=3415678 RepID=UPI003CF0ED21